MLRAKEAASKALKIDDSLPDAHTVLAVIRFIYDWDWAGAEEEFKRVIQLHPYHAAAYHEYGWYLMMIGRQTEAIEQMKQAQQLDPISRTILVNSHAPFYFAGQYDLSIERSREAMKMDPNFYLSHYTLGIALAQKGEFAEGIAELQRARAVEDQPWIVGTLGYAYAVSGKRGEAKKLIDELKELSKLRHVPPYWIGVIYAGLGEKDEAFAWLEKAYAERTSWLVWLKVDPMLKSLRSDPRYADLLRRVNLSQ